MPNRRILSFSIVVASACADESGFDASSEGGTTTSSADESDGPEAEPDCPGPPLDGPGAPETACLTDTVCFETQRYFVPDAHTDRYRIGGHALGDLDRDGHVDVVLVVRGDQYACDYPGHGILAFGDGAGSFRSSSRVDLGPGGIGVHLADIDLNGALDIVANGYVTLGAGDGTFTGRMEGGGGHWWVSIVDLTRDGLLDLLVVYDQPYWEDSDNSEAGPHLLLLENDGAGGLSSGEDEFADRIWGPMPRPIRVGDRDYAFAGLPSSCRITLIDYDDGFVYEQIADVPDRVCDVSRVADLDRDGKADIVTAGRRTDPSGDVVGFVGVIRQLDGGAFASYVELGELAGLPTEVAVADVTRDGIDDLVLASAAVRPTHLPLGGIIVFPGAGDESFEPHIDLEYADSTLALQIDDLNEDGHADVVYTTSKPLGLHVFVSDPEATER